MAKKPDKIDRMRRLFCWIKLLLFTLALALPPSRFQTFAFHAIICMAVLQFTYLRHY